VVRLPFRNIADKVLRQNFEFLAEWLFYNKFQRDTLTWPGGDRLTTVLTVAHGLGRTPIAVLTNSSTPNMTVATSGYTETTFDAQGNTVDGTSPPAATARDFVWMAVA
jgi:hypothetical protein